MSLSMVTQQGNSVSVCFLCYLKAYLPLVYLLICTALEFFPFIICNNNVFFGCFPPQLIPLAGAPHENYKKKKKRTDTISKYLLTCSSFVKLTHSYNYKNIEQHQYTHPRTVYCNSTTKI